MQPLASSDAINPSGPAGSGQVHTDTPEGERELVRKLTADFETDARREAPLMADFDKWRDYLRGKTHGGNFAVNVNLCQATMGVLVPKLYARNPEVAVTPADAIEPARFEDVRGFGRTCEILVNNNWRKRRGYSGIKGRIKRCVRGTLTVGFAWLKAAMQIDMARDPVMETRINDLQDNLAEIDRKIREAEEGNYPCASEELHREELTIELQAAQAKLEVERAQGMVYANPRIEDVFVSGEIRELCDYLEADRITHRTWWRVERVAARYGLTAEQLKGAQRYTLIGEAAAPKHVTENEQGEWLAVLERWDKQAGVVHTWVLGTDFLLRPSSPPNPSSSRFYPFFLMAWQWVDDTRLPLSDVAQWAPLQDEYNSVRSNFKEHRRRSMPGLVGNGAVINEGDANKLTSNESNELVLLQGIDPSIPIGNLIVEKKNAAIDPALYDTRPILYDLDVVSGVQEAARQAIKTPKTATEAEIQEASGAGRTTERVDSIEDFMGDLAQYEVELMAQCLTIEQVLTICGPGAVWPEDLSIDEIHQLVNIEIRAGTTGKPDTAKQQQAWGVLAPMIEAMLEKIWALREQAMGGAIVDPATGQMVQQPPNPMAAAKADALEELLKETVKRSDDRIDVTRFLPPDTVTPAQQMPAPAGPVPGMPGAPAPGAAAPVVAA